MTLSVLAREKPVQAFGPKQFSHILSRAAKGVDGERGVPGGKIGVDRPTAVGADRVGEELDAALDHLGGNVSGPLAPRAEGAGIDVVRQGFRSRSERTTSERTTPEGNTR